MEFSELYPYKNGKTCKLSPDGNFISLVHSSCKERLIIRDIHSLSTFRMFRCVGEIQEVHWSPDSNMIMCGMLKKGIVQVWDLDDPEWCCKLEDSVGNISSIRWSIDGQHILTVSEFQIQMTVWSIRDQSVFYIKNPKYSNQGLAFSHNGIIAALAERRECKDFIDIFSVSSWDLIHQFEVETRDLVDLAWSPDDRTICVWDSPTCFRVLLYSLDGTCLRKYEPYSDGLGVKSVSWAPSGQLLSIGSYDQKLRILNPLTWREIAEFSHPSIVSGNSMYLYRESEFEDPNARPILQRKYILESQNSVQITSIKPPVNQANPKVGVSVTKWSQDGLFLFTINDNMPHALWIWDVAKLSLHTILLQLEPIKAVEWSPNETKLIFTTGSKNLYIWTPEESSCCQLPLKNFEICNFRWNGSGNSLLLLDKEQFCLIYLEEDIEEE